MVLPAAFLMKRGSAPTDLNALTGLLTPPGIAILACWKSALERVWFMAECPLLILFIEMLVGNGVF
jgi:hypothetical protein